MAQVTFDGPNKHINVESGVTELNVQIDVYSGWKVWIQVADNAKYDPALRTVGGDTTAAGQFSPRYFFLLNGWRVRVDGLIVPDLEVAINLYVDGGGSPFIILNGANVSNLRSDIGIVEVEVGEGGGSSNDLTELTEMVEDCSATLDAQTADLADLTTLVENCCSSMGGGGSAAVTEIFGVMSSMSVIEGTVESGADVGGSVEILSEVESGAIEDTDVSGDVESTVDLDTEIDSIVEIILPHVTVTASEILPRYAFCTAFGALGNANSEQYADANIVGIQHLESEILIGDRGDLAYEGTITNPAWSFVPGDPVFLGTGGQPTQVVPTVGWNAVIGIASSPSTMTLDLQQPIRL